MDVNKTETQTPQTTPQTSEQQGAMTSRPAHPGRTFLSLRDDIDRLFDTMLMTPLSRRLFDMDLFRRAGMVSDVTPRVDVVETPEAVELTAELPGLEESDLDVSVGDGVVTIRGEKKLEKERTEAGYHLSERSYGSFTRSFPLPENVDADAIEAQYERGVLKLTLPKREKTEPPRRKIEIKGKA